MTYEFHTEILRNIARQMRPAVYVELGVFMGDTLNAVLPYVEGKAFACDIHKKFVPNILPQFSYRVEDYSDINTFDFASIWQDEIKQPIDLIFIDADHSKESVYKDIMNFWPFLKEDTGLMVLHDMWPPSARYVDPGYCGDGFMVKEKIKKELPDLEFISLPLQYGVGIMRKIGKAWQNGRLDS